MPGPRPVAVQLNAEERAGLEVVSTRPSTPQQIALRARIVLAAAASERNAVIACELNINVHTVRLPSREQTGRGGDNAGLTYNRSRLRT